MNILILDDDTQRAKDWKEVILINTNGKVSIEVYEEPDVSKVIANLHKARYSSREGAYCKASDLDKFDLLIVDYDLLGLESEVSSAWSTGAEIAYAARLMCDVGPIVVVNQFGTNSFDLTMKRASGSYAAFDIGSQQIISANLWGATGFNGFRPWHWPDLLREADRFSCMKSFVLENLDKPILGTLGFYSQNIDSPRFIGHEIIGRLGLSSSIPTTFRDLVKERGRHIGVFNILEKDREIIEKMDDDQVARLASVIVWHWLEKIVLPGQEVIADLPHLCSKYPWLVIDCYNPDAWSLVCNLSGPEGVHADLEAFRFNPDFMLSRPVYWVGEVKSKFRIPSDFNMGNMPRLVFCEDSSSFNKKIECQSYPSDLLSFDRERWVKGDLKMPDGAVNYEPQSYLLM